jgi:hypothetical protein
MRRIETVTRRAMLASLLIVAAAAPAARAFADDANGSATAQELFDEGIRLMKIGRYNEACPKLAASQRQDPGAGTQLALARCYEKNGQIASAWATYQEAASAAHEAGHPDWEQNARDSFQALEPKLSRLTIRVPPESDLQDLMITRDGKPVDRAAWSSAIPVDPGGHDIAVSASNHETWTKTVDVPPDHASVELVVPPLKAQSTTSPPPTASATTTVQPPPSPPPPPQPPPTNTTTSASSSDGSGQRTTGLVVMALGGAAAIAGGVFGLLAMSTHSSAMKECDSLNRCTQHGLDQDQTARSQATVSTVAFIVSGVALAGGAAIYFTAPSNKEAQPGVALGVAPTWGGAGLLMRGAW